MPPSLKSPFGSDIVMQKWKMPFLENDILCYLYVLKMKYGVDSASLARLCYKMERHVSVVKPAIVILIARGILNIQHQGDKVTYAISREGIDFIENNGMVKIRNWIVEDV
jgi:predicted transcriptional regulator